MKLPEKLLTGALNEYRPIDLIKEGGMAKVFRAQAVTDAEGLERPVALKKILPEFAADEMFVAMFLDEARIAARLDHPNIVKTLDFGRWDETYFIAMEFVDGCDLSAVLAKCRETGAKVPIRHACRIVADVSDALSYVHNRCEAGAPMEIVHRDVSPDNVIISDGGVVKLTDFGVAKAADRRAWTFVGSVKGKAPYMAPERIDGKGDHRSDIFAAGILLWEVLTNERLFQGECDWEIIQRIERGDFPAPSTRNAAISKTLDGIVAKALALRPEDRYQDAAELQDALRRFCVASGEQSSERALAAWTRRVMHGRFQTHSHAPAAPARTVSSKPGPNAKRRRPRRLRAQPETGVLRPDAHKSPRIKVRQSPRVNAHVIRRFAGGTPALPIQALEFDVEMDSLDDFDIESEETRVHPRRQVPSARHSLTSQWLMPLRRDKK